MTDTPKITEEEYQKAREVAAAYERMKAEEVAAQRAAYAVHVTELVTSDAFKAVYAALASMLATQTDDSFYGMPVNALHTISRNLASQVNVNMDAPVAPTPSEGEADGE